MARKANSSKPPGPKTGFRPSFERTKPPKAAAAADPGTSAQQGMLQLTFARHAHGYGFLAAIAFFFNGVLLVTFAGRPLPITGLRLDYVLWLLPAVAGALTSWDAVRLKREPYRRHYVSRHFATSAAGMGLFFVVALAIIAAMQGSLPLWVIPLIYPISAAGVPLTIISMGLTWQGLGARKLGSLGAALIMPVLMVFLTLFSANFTVETESGRALFIIIYLIGALTTEIAGSLLHIIASSTSVYQREILKADNTKVAIIQQDYQKKREALDYKERALRGREAHLEALQQELEDQAKDLKGKLGDVTTREVAIEKGTNQLRELDRKVASARAEIEAKAEEMRLKDSDLAGLKKELEKTRQSVGAREASLAEREKEVKRASIELTSKVRGSETKLKSVEERESELRMKSERLEATHSAGEATRIRELKDWESKILAKEKEVGKKEVEVKTLESQLRERYENATRIDKQFQGQRRSFEDRETEFVSREKTIADQEAALRQRAAEIDRQASSVEEAQRGLDDKTKKYAELFKDAKMKEAAAGSNAEDVKRQEKTLASREKKVAEMQSNLQTELKRLK